MATNQAQEELQNALLTTFLANLTFLREYDNKLFQRVDGLSQLISDGTFKENYRLEFIKEDGDFDVYDIKNEKYLYNRKPKKYNRNAYHQVDFTSKGSVSTLDEELFRGSLFDILPEAEYMCNLEYSNMRLANETLKYYDILRDNISSYKFKKFKYVSKFMFVGTMLGRHIPLMAEKLKIQNSFVCEQNLEIFRLSLFVVDYSNLARDGKSVVFSIMEDSHEFFTAFDKFLANRSYDNYCIRYFSTNYNVKNNFNSILSSILAHKSTTFNHHMMLENVWKNMTSRVNNYNIIQIKQKSNDKILDKKLLYIGAGPSLEDNIQWLKENRDNFLIVAIGATYKILLKQGITPDIVSTLDPQYSVLNKNHFDIQNVKKLKDCYILAAINTDQRILDRFNQDKLFLYEMVKPMHSLNICYKGFSVGEITASILLTLGFKEMYILGIDFAINQETGSSHTGSYKNTEYEDDFEDKLYDENSNEFTLKKELIKVKGNLQDEVYTTRLFSLSLDAISSNFSLIKKTNQKVYNLSNHGAYFENTIPTKINNLNFENEDKIEKTKLDSDLGKYLKSISKKTLDKSDYNDLQKELEYLLKVKDEFITLKDSLSESFDDFKVKVDKLVKNLLYPGTYCSFLPLIFTKYYDIFLQYIYYSLNDQKLKHEKRKIKEVEALFLNETIALLDKYISYLKQV